MSDHIETPADRDRRVASAERVAAGMLHEVRNVLNPIVSAAFLLEASANDPAMVRELARRIEGFAKAEQRVAAKMRELLDREATGEAAGEATREAAGSVPTSTAGAGRASVPSSINAKKP